MLKRIIMALAAVLTAISPALPAKLNIPILPKERTIDMTQFEMTWQDEFNGSALDQSKWGHSWWETIRRGGYWHEDMVSVENGNLIIRTEYKDTPLENRYYEQWHDVIRFDEYKSGYYTGELNTRGKFEQRYGYFECRCILPAGYGFWAAFWMMNEGVFREDGNGRDGTELDVFESMYYRRHPFGIDAISCNLHFDGYNENHQGMHIGEFMIENDPYSEYNTYGIEWNEKEYIFYINGKEYARSDFGGVSREPEHLILSVEVAGENGVPYKRPATGAITRTKIWPAEFIVDYVRAYQYKTVLAQETAA